MDEFNETFRRILLYDKEDSQEDVTITKPATSLRKINVVSKAPGPNLPDREGKRKVTPIS